MIRYCFFFLLAFVLAGCVSSGKYKALIATTQATTQQQADSIQVLQDSTFNLLLALERSKGGNDALLVAQDKHLDRLAEQEEELDQLRGSLTSTNFQMTNQVTKLREELELTYDAFAAFRSEHRTIVRDFETGMNDAANVLRKALDGKIADEAFDIISGEGVVTLSVQEDQLFRSKSVDRLVEAAPVILEAILETVQSDPLLKLTVVGHTDNQPNPRRNTNNWEYAALRATFIAEELAQTYYLSPNRVVAASHGEYGPATSNATDEGQAKNRRIDFVLRNNVGNLLRELKKLNRE